MPELAPDYEELSELSVYSLRQNIENLLVNPD
jgi:hypothetical protein